METELPLEFKIVMFDGPDTEVLARVSHLEFGTAVYMAAVAKYPKRNIDLRHGARVIREHRGEPTPAPPVVDPNLKSWSVHLLGGKKAQHLGFVLAADEASALKTAGEKFTHLTEAQRKRLAVNPAR